MQGLGRGPSGYVLTQAVLALGAGTADPQVPRRPCVSGATYPHPTLPSPSWGLRREQSLEK